MKKNLTISLQRPRGGVYSAMAKTPGIHLLFIGALACTRHRSFEMLELQKQGRLSFLCLDEVDFITGGYLTKIEQAILEIAEEKKPTGFLLTPGCQSALLSTDYKLLVEDLQKQLGIPICVHEACHLCGLESETSGGKPDTIEQMIFDFLRPAARSEKPAVNIISAVPIDPRCELYSLLENAGVERINEIDQCRSFEEYQRMAGAHLNIICAGNAESLGRHLEEKLGIPYVVLCDVYAADGLKKAYECIGQILGAKLDVSEYCGRLEKRMHELCGRISDAALTIEGSPAVAKWLCRSGVPVSAVAVNFRMSVDPDILSWFKENAPEVTIGRGSGRPGGGHSGRDGRPGGSSYRGRDRRPDGNDHPGRDGRPGGNGHPDGSRRPGNDGRHGGGRLGQGAVTIGFLAAENILDELEKAIRSAEE